MRIRDGVLARYLLLERWSVLTELRGMYGCRAELSRKSHDLQQRDITTALVIAFIEVCKSRLEHCSVTVLLSGDSTCRSYSAGGGLPGSPMSPERVLVQVPLSITSDDDHARMSSVAGLL